jgi:hypothetical protein
MRIAAPRGTAPLLPSVTPALAGLSEDSDGQAPVHATPDKGCRLSTWTAAGWRASLSPRASFRFLHIRRRTGTTTSRVDFLVLREEGDIPSPPSPAPPLAPCDVREMRWLTSRAGSGLAISREACLRDRSSFERRIASAFQRPIPLLERDSAHLVRRARSASRGGPSRAFCAHRTAGIARGRDARPLRPPRSVASREGRYVLAKTEVRSTAIAPLRARGSLPAFAQVDLSSTQHLCSGRAPTLCSWESLRLFNPP